MAHGYEDPMPRGASPDKSEPSFWNRLYHNNRDGSFTDVTQTAGLQGHSYGMGVATGDYDNDGNIDLLVTNLGGNILYHNNGDGTFTDVTAKAGVGGSGWCTGACFVDYDRDGAAGSHRQPLCRVGLFRTFIAVSTSRATVPIAIQTNSTLFPILFFATTGMEPSPMFRTVRNRRISRKGAWDRDQRF